MAPGVCVTSFRMFMRRSDVSHWSRGLRLTPVGTLTVNSWHLSGRNYSTDAPKDSDTGQHNAKSASQSAERESIAKANNAQASITASNVSQNNLKDTDLTQMKVEQLKAQLRLYNLSTTGKRQILLERLQKFLQQQKDASSRSTGTQNNSGENAPAIMLSQATKPSMAVQLSQTSTQTHSPVAIAATNCSETNVRTTSTSTITATNTASTRFDKDIKHSNVNYAAPPNAGRTPGDVTVEYIQGLPHLTVPLPSRNEKCRFALRPVSHRVGDLINMLKEEDRGIDRATVLNDCGVRIASTCNIESLMNEPFWLHINNNKYKVVPPEREKVGVEDSDKLGDIRLLVAQLYEALNVGEYHIQKEQELTSKLENLKYQIAPMERLKAELHSQAERKTSVMTWVGLGLMSVQFGILARLTWWEYSWDIMEPVTYFVTYGTAMAMYAYYCITKTEYNLNEVKDREYLLTVYKRAKKKKFDIDGYNDLRRQIAELEFDLRRLRDPLNLQLPPHVDRAQQNLPAKAAPSADEIAPEAGKKHPWTFKLPFLEPKN